MLRLAVVLSAVLPAQASPGSPVDPCAAARAPLDAHVAAAAGAARPEIESYRRAWLAACARDRGPADLARLLSDADALVQDVKLGVAAAQVAAAVGDAPWPLPGIHRTPEGVAVDGAAFVAAASLGTAEDGRFFRALGAATDADGEPAWLGRPPRAGAPACVRLAEVSWAELAAQLDQLDRAAAAPYQERARELRGAVMATLGEIAKGGAVCGCTRGDPVRPLVTLVEAGAKERLGTPARRALLRAAADALGAIQSGRARVEWLRAAPDAPPAGCGAEAR